MSWYNSSWTRRTPISVRETKAAANSDATAVLSPIMEDFWDNVQTDGDDIRVTDADGLTLEAYDLASFNATTRAGTVEIQNAAIETSWDVTVFWLYYGNAAVASAVTSFSPSSPEPGAFAPEVPSGLIFRAGPEQPGATIPQTQIAKQENETLFFYVDFTDLLLRLSVPYQDSTVYEEPAAASVAIYSGGTLQTSMLTEGNTRVVEHDGRIYVRGSAKAGTSGTDYRLQVELKTSLGQTRIATALLRVRTTSEA